MSLWRADDEHRAAAGTGATGHPAMEQHPFVVQDGLIRCQVP